MKNQRTNEMIAIHFLKQSDIQQKIAIRQFSKLSIDMRIQIMQEHRKIFYALKQKNEQEDITVLSYVALIHAILVFSENKNDAIRISKIKNGLKKSRPKSDILLDRWSLIKELKNEHKLSFRDIATYLIKYHKIKIAHSTIYNMWKKLEKKDEKNG